MSSRPAGRLTVERTPWTTGDNPYQLAVYDSLAAHGVDLVGTVDLADAHLTARTDRPDVLHIHWRLDRLAENAPGGADAAGWVCDRLDRIRRAGTVLAWTVHEPGALLDPRDPYRSTVEEHLLTTADVVFVHDEPTARRVAALAPPLRDRPLTITTTPLGDYRPLVRASEPDPARLAAARDRLQVDPDARVVLAHGSLRADKDLPLLVDAFDRLGRDDAVLAIVGRADGEATFRTLRSLVGPNIRLLTEHLPGPDAAATFGIAEVAVLARRVDWTSSSLLFAVAHDTPVVAADLPTSRAVVGDRGATWSTPGDPESLAGALRRALDDPAAASATLREAQRHIATRSWDRSARVAAAALRDAVAERRVAGRGVAPAATGA